MNNLQVFSNFEFGSVRTSEMDEKVYFCGSDVARVLGYDQPHKAIKAHCREDGVMICTVIDNLGREQSAKFISEGNLYRLISRSKLPSAERFERWVFDEVLPTIRKQKSYGFENIQQIISMTVVETVKQLIPLIQQNNTLGDTEEIIIKRQRRKTPGIIEKLPADLRNVVDGMICDNKHTYRDIIEMLADEGISITQASVCRYAQRYF